MQEISYKKYLIWFILVCIQFIKQLRVAETKTTARDTSRDGLSNEILTYALSNLKLFGNFVQSIVMFLKAIAHTKSPSIDKQ